MVYGYTAETCSIACETYTYFALQNGGWCCCSDSYADATQYGVVTTCPDSYVLSSPDCHHFISTANILYSQLGAAWANDLFVHEPGILKHLCLYSHIRSFCIIINSMLL